MAFRLPELQGRLPIVDRLGVPLNSFLRWWNVDFVGALVAQEKRQDATDVALQEQIDKLERVLAGLEPFTGINVGGTNVKPFLDKTDGDKLVDDTGLDTNVVVTRTLNDGAANQVLTAYSGNVSVTALIPTVVQTIVLTTVAGEVTDFAGQFGYNELTSPSAVPNALGFWQRNGTPLVPSANYQGQDITRAADSTRYVLPRGIATVVTTDIPGAGTHTYELMALYTESGSAINPYGRVITATRP